MLPLLIEVGQLLITPLDRACQSADVFDNLTGLVLGFALGAIASATLRGGRDDGAAGSGEATAESGPQAAPRPRMDGRE